MKTLYASGVVLAVCLMGMGGSVWAASKVFSGAGDGSAWQEPENWSPSGAPALTDTATIDVASIAVSASQDFLAESVIVGGKSNASWMVEPFVYGTIIPVTTADPAILLRNGGTVVFQGAGVVKAKGPFKSSNEALPSEPSVMILLQ